MERKSRASESGQGIVEFAVIFPLFIMLIFVMIDGGLLMGHNSRVHHAIDEGARLAAVGAETASIRNAIEDQSHGLIDGSSPLQCPSAGDEEVCIEWYRGPNGENPGEVGSRVLVSAHYHYYFVTPIDTIAGGFGGEDHFSIDPCSIVILERPIDLEADDAIGSGDPSC